ncbi:MAG: response regulator [Planctomycetes bacterium]|nr:response regulator [Planctomycetota bacterium]
MAETSILVADDEPFIVRLLTFVLRKRGFSVAEARDGEEALDLVRAKRPKIAFVDAMMPKMNGYELCRAIKKDPDLRDTHLIMLTAKGQDSDRDRGLEAGADEYMTKPFSPSQVLQRVTEILQPFEG